MSKEQLERVHPINGGCWFCFGAQELPGGWLFTTEWDANVHKLCLEQELQKPEPAMEAAIMAREFGMEGPKQ